MTCLSLPSFSTRPSDSRARPSCSDVTPSTSQAPDPRRIKSEPTFWGHFWDSGLTFLSKPHFWGRCSFLSWILGMLLLPKASNLSYHSASCESSGCYCACHCYLSHSTSQAGPAQTWELQIQGLFVHFGVFMYAVLPVCGLVIMQSLLFSFGTGLTPFHPNLFYLSWLH